MPASMIFLRTLDVAAPPMVERNIRYAVVSLRRLHHETGLVGVLRHRLFGEHMHAGVQGGHRYRRMQNGRGGNAQTSSCSMINKILPVRIALLLWNVVRVAKLLQPIGLHSRQSNKINISRSGVPGHVLLSRPAQADDAGAKSTTLAHASMLSGRAPLWRWGAGMSSDRRRRKVGALFGIGPEHRIGQHAFDVGVVVDRVRLIAGRESRTPCPCRVASSNQTERPRHR